MRPGARSQQWSPRCCVSAGTMAGGSWRASGRLNDHSRNNIITGSALARQEHYARGYDHSASSLPPPPSSGLPSPRTQHHILCLNFLHEPHPPSLTLVSPSIPSSLPLSLHLPSLLDQLSFFSRFQHQILCLNFLQSLQPLLSLVSVSIIRPFFYLSFPPLFFILPFILSLSSLSSLCLNFLDKPHPSLTLVSCFVPSSLPLSFHHSSLFPLLPFSSYLSFFPPFQHHSFA